MGRVWELGFWRWLGRKLLLGCFVVWVLEFYALGLSSFFNEVLGRKGFR